MSVHPTAIVSEHAIIDPSTSIGPYAIVEDDVTIGKNNCIMAHAFIGKGAKIGNNNKIHMGAVVGHIPQDMKFDEDMVTQLHVGDNNTIREYVTIHRSTDPEQATTIGNNCLLMGGCHIAHDCHVGNSVIMANMSAMAGHVTVGDRAFISGGVMIHQFVTIGRLAILSGNARFSVDIPPFVIGAEKNQVWGINVIGLRRANFSSQTIKEIKMLYRLFFKNTAPMPQAVEKIRSQSFSSPEIEEFLEFVENSKRGICRAASEMRIPVQE